MVNEELIEYFSPFSENEIDKAELQIDEYQKIVDYEIREYTIDILISKFNEGKEKDKAEIFIPKYQRSFVWNEVKQSQFIESLLMGLPMSYIFTADTVEGRSEILDGTQRIRTLDYFLNNKLVLQGLEKLTSLNGFRFKDFSIFRQRRFKKKTIRLIELTDKADWTIKIDLWERLNSFSPLVRLNDIEMRQMTYKGHFRDFIQKCADDPRFRILCPISDERIKREEYAEFALRFFAYSENLSGFVHSVRDFLNDYIKDKNENSFDAEKMNDDFQDVLDFVEKHFPYGFKKTENHKSTPRVRFEAIAVGVRLALNENPNLIPVIPVKKWLLSEQFEAVVTTDAANNKNKVLERIYFVRDKLLQKV